MRNFVDSLFLKNFRMNELSPPPIKNKFSPRIEKNPGQSRGFVLLLSAMVDQKVIDQLLM